MSRKIPTTGGKSRKGLSDIRNRGLRSIIDNWNELKIGRQKLNSLNGTLLCVK